MPRNFLEFTPVLVVILTFTLSLCVLILYGENRGGYSALYPTFLSESSVLLTLVASLSSYNVCLRFFLLVNINAYLLFLHGVKLSCYIQTYCIIYIWKTCSVLSLLKKQFYPAPRALFLHCPVIAQLPI